MLWRGYASRRGDQEAGRGDTHLVLHRQCGDAVGNYNCGSSSAPQLYYLLSWLCSPQPQVQFLAEHVAGVRNNTVADKLNRGRSQEVLAEVEAAGVIHERLQAGVEAGIVLSHVSTLEHRSPS